MQLPHSATKLWHTGSRWATRLFGSAPLFLTVTLIGVCTGTLVFAITYTPPAATPQSSSGPAEPDSESVESARTSLQEAQLLFGFLSGAATSASSGISTVTASAGQIFDSIDTARLGADQLVQALDTAPDLTIAADQIAAATTTAGTAVAEAQNLSAVATQFDEIVTPLLTTLNSLPAPGTRETRDNLLAMQTSARALATDLDSVAGLQDSLGDLGTSVKSSATSANSAIASAQTSAVGLRDGLSTLADARTDAVAAAEQVTAGVDQLAGVLTSIGDDLTAASDSLAVDPESTEPAESTEIASMEPAPDTTALTTAKAIGYGALTGLVVLLLISAITGRTHSTSRAAAA
ncbi:hypothetical protein [Williamsia sp.]|uniref:hypothetical protein n=1 Tax=Williamsia sp. TaxID=1872085 RepID=UPI002F93D202